MPDHREAGLLALLAFVRQTPSRGHAHGRDQVLLRQFVLALDVGKGCRSDLCAQAKRVDRYDVLAARNQVVPRPTMAAE